MTARASRRLEPGVGPDYLYPWYVIITFPIPYLELFLSALVKGGTELLQRTESQNPDKLFRLCFLNVWTIKT